MESFNVNCFNGLLTPKQTIENSWRSKGAKNSRNAQFETFGEKKFDATIKWNFHESLMDCFILYDVETLFSSRFITQTSK